MIKPHIGCGQRRVAMERRRPRQKFVEDNTRRIDIASGIDTSAPHLFRGQVGNSPHHHRRRRQGGFSRRPNQPKISQFYLVIVANQDIFGLHIPVN